MIAYIDPSALAKWYLNEARSEEVVAYLSELDERIVSSLTLLEMRSLLARRRRSGELEASLEARIFAQLESDVAAHHLLLRPVEDRHIRAAAGVMERVPEQPLRSLDAMHLALATDYAVDELATADAVMAAAAAALGLPVARF